MKKPAGACFDDSAPEEQREGKRHVTHFHPSGSSRCRQRSSGGLLDRVGGILDGKALFSDGKDAPAGEADAKKGGLLKALGESKHCTLCEVRYFRRCRCYSAALHAVSCRSARLDHSSNCEYQGKCFCA